MAQQQAKLKEQKRPETINRREDEDLQLKRNKEDFATMQFALENHNASSPETILQLQRLVGNSQTAKVVTPLRSTGAVQLGKDGFSRLEESGPDDGAQEKVSKLKQLGDKMQEYYAIHKNYKKYKKYIGGKAWNLLDAALGLVKKAAKWIKKVDPSGIAAAIQLVTAAVQEIVSKINEAYLLMTDPELVEQLTPLLKKGLSFSTVKESVQEAFDFGSAIKSAVDAVVELV